MSNLKVIALRHARQSRKECLSLKGPSLDTSKLAALTLSAVSLSRAVSGNYITFATSPTARTTETTECLMKRLHPSKYSPSPVIAPFIEERFSLLTSDDRFEMYETGIRELSRIALGNAEGRNAALVLVTHDMVIHQLAGHFIPDSKPNCYWLDMNVLNGDVLDSVLLGDAYAARPLEPVLV